ncbi:uncharacterized protein FA14DRAFT_87423 [Meira miltonrushii]|uniref:Uncharacterized protein n=1 Tax=Meira miltonrushii TaxID=1280837 RepID=A0A316V5N7_9BASI|nr:uncharacterized protein FA14DRAFT_87423 [Meira miltonrushii]PWN32338.1 hypothetical protein FA14DRAFT_87423 [Meira miltonrushii]
MRMLSVNLYVPRPSQVIGIPRIHHLSTARAGDTVTIVYFYLFEALLCSSPLFERTGVIIPPDRLSALPLIFISFRIWSQQHRIQPKRTNDDKCGDRCDIQVKDQQRIGSGLDQQCIPYLKSKTSNRNETRSTIECQLYTSAFWCPTLPQLVTMQSVY